MAFKPGQGSRTPVNSADFARLATAGVELEQCERCKGTGIRESYFDSDGERVDEECAVCAGRGATTWDGCQVPETLRAGALRCARCKTSTLSEHSTCDCCGVCGASPAEQCDGRAHVLAEAA